MNYKWNENKKVEKYDSASKKNYVELSTPKYIIKNPHGFRQEDILHSLCIALSDLIDGAEAEEKALKQTLQFLNKEEKGDPLSPPV